MSDGQGGTGQEEVLRWLGRPESFGLPATCAGLPDHAVCQNDDAFVRIDTHAAIVTLAGPFAYKVKRAVRFPFLDFSTLAKREQACRAELAINGALAPQLYLAVAAIRRSETGLVLDETPGPHADVVEWAVKMRRFPIGNTLDRIADRGELTAPLVAELARAVAAAHAGAEIRADPIAVETSALILRQNAEAFAEVPELFPSARAEALIASGLRAFAAGHALLSERCRAGFVRRCHGDLHLRNIVLLDGVPTLFDAIEFDERIATCDLLYDLAFLVMDLWQRGLHAQANAVLNRYLWLVEAAHLTGLSLLPLFISIRASIRAKVTAAGLAHLGEAARQASAAEARAYFELAIAALAESPRRLVAIGGLSGSGKSTLAAGIAPHVGAMPGAVHLRSDIERKRLFGVAETQRLPAEAYDKAHAAEVYRVLEHKAALALAAGRGVVVDAVYARPEERAEIEAVAARLGVAFTGVWLDAPQDERARRVECRTGDASDATAAVVARQVDYDLGEIGWTRLDAGQPPASVTLAAQALLDLV